MTRLLDQLPEIVEEGRRRALRLMEETRDPLRPRLRTRELIRRPDTDLAGPGTWTNDWIEGDNLAAMAALLEGDGDAPGLRGGVDLIYVDPPFASQADYRRRIRLPTLPPVARASAKPARARADTADTPGRAAMIEPFAYSDLWPGGLPAYLRMLAPRFVLMRELLADTGSLYVHVDPVVGHYVKVMLDAVFGRERFQREIVWRIGWVSGFKSAAPNWIRNHDLIFYYAKTADFVFNKQYLPYLPGYVRRDGQAPTGRGYPLEDTWNCSEMDRMDSIQIMSLSQEKLGYDTQKNENLLARIISASSHPGALVADFFAGSGTTAAVAERLGRRWIAVDAGRPAGVVACKRLAGMQARPFTRKVVLGGGIDAAGAILDTGTLAQRVLAAVGATPLEPTVEVPQAPVQPSVLGEVASAGVRTLVWVDRRDRITDADSLRGAAALRERKPARWDRLLLLGWHLDPALGTLVPDRNDSLGDGQPPIEVRRIPSALLDAPAPPGAVDARRAPWHFEGLGRLDVEGISRTVLPATDDGTTSLPAHPQEQLDVRLRAYRLPPAGTLALGDADLRRLLQAQQVDPIAAVEYWAVDPDYDGLVFRAQWQGVRGGAAAGFRAPAEARLVVTRRAGSRRVCVRAVDVFGNEAEVVRELQEPGPEPAPED